MSDLVKEFATFLDRYELRTTGGLTNAALDQMKPDQARFFRLCAIPHHFNPEILKTLAPELDYESAVRNCVELATNPSINAYSTHLYTIADGVRNHLFNEWLKPDCRQEFVQASQRLVGYFSKEHEEADNADAYSRRVNRVFHLIGSDLNDGFREYEKLFNERRHRSLLGDCDALIELAREYDRVFDANQRATITYQEGKVAADRLQLEKAKKLFEAVRGEADIDPVLWCKTTVRLGLVESENRNWSTAIGHFNDSLDMLAKLEDGELSKKLKHRIKLSLGITYREMGDVRQAMQFLRASIHEAHRVRSESGMAIAYNSLGILFRKMGEADVAIKAYKKSLDLLERLKQPYRLAQIHNNLGLAYLDAHRLKEGEAALNISLKIKADTGDTIGRAKTLNNLMQLYRIQQLEQKAVEAGLKAMKYFGEVGDYYDMGLTSRNVGRLFRSLGKRDEAQKHFSEAISLFEKSRATGEVAALKEEVNFLTLTPTKGMPWWAWALYIIVPLVVLSFAVLLAIALLSLGAKVQERTMAPPGFLFLQLLGQ